MKTLAIMKSIRGAFNHLTLAGSPAHMIGALAALAALALATTPAHAAPVNDSFANAIALLGSPTSGQTGSVSSGTQTGTDNADATSEGEEPALGSGATNTVWFKWTCPNNGNFTVSTLGSTNTATPTPAEFDAVLGIYSGASLNALAGLPGTPQDGNFHEEMTVAVTAGTTYFIQVGGFNVEAAANILLTWNFAATINEAKILTFGPGAVVGVVFENAAEIGWSLSPGTNLATLTPTFTLSPGATCMVGGNPVVSGAPVDFSGGPVVFTVTAQGGSPINDYTVTTVVGKVVLWNLAADGAWDLSTPNWLGQVSNVAENFVDGDAVIFNKVEGGTINIDSTVVPYSTTVSAASGAYTFGGGSIGGAGSLTKSGNGTLTLASANLYSGATVVNGGTLQANGNSAIGSSTSFAVANGAVLLLTGGTSPDSTWPTTAAPLTGAGTVSINLNTTIGTTGLNFDMSAFTGSLGISNGRCSINPFFSPGFVSPTGGTLNVGNAATLYLGWQGTTFNTTVQLSSGTDNGEGVGVLRATTATLNGAVILATNSTIGADDTFNMNAVISDGGNGFGFTKVSGGTLILSATNTYGGTTSITAGTLRCNSPGSLGGGALSINGGKLNLNYSGTKTIASLTLGGAPQTTPGTYGSLASGATFPNDTHFTTGSTGTVTVSAASGFATWADANAPGQTPAQDHDNDGVDNGIEYFMGQSGSSFTAMPGLNGTNTVTWPMSPTYAGSYEVQTSPDLGTWTNVTPKPLPSGGNLSYTLPPGLGKRFVRLFVTPTP